MTSFNHARAWSLTVGALCSCACSGAAPEEASGKPAADTHAASAQAEPKCPAGQEQLIDLGAFGAEPALGRSFGTALNEHGTVVGYSSFEEYKYHAFRWKADTGMVALDALGEATSWAWGINEQEEVVGGTYMPGASGYAVSRAALWDSANVYHDLGTLGGPTSLAVAINNRGQVIGRADDETGESVPFIWEAKTGMRRINLPEFNRFNLDGINDAGAVGGYFLGYDHTRVPFKWTEQGGFTKLDRLGGSEGYALGINNQDEIVGTSC